MSTKEKNVDLVKWSGPKRPYDLLKNLVFTLIPLTALVVAFALAFGSPDVRAVTLQDWAQAAPTDFVMTATGELAGTTRSASYGPPYNNGSEGQALGPLKLQKLLGVHIPIDPANDFVVEPLKSSREASVYTTLGQWAGANADQQSKLATDYTAAQNAGLSAALGQWTSASTDQQIKWATQYKAALERAGDRLKVAADPAYGPVQIMTASLLALAQGGILDGILTTESSPYPSDFTKPLLFLADGEYLGKLASTHHLEDGQMGMINETGSYPGQFWLLPLALLYQVDPFKSSENVDAQVFAVIVLLALGLAFCPKIPVLNRLPRLIPLHRVIWRNYYRKNNL
ncbi:MAG: hypothetical protein AABY37_02555 [Actinomycetota bacterium]